MSSATDDSRGEQQQSRCFKVTIAYDGGAYAGWQVQPNGPTIQAAMETAVRSVCGRDVRVMASGRTDAGVHAVGQVVSFETPTHLAADVWRRALNANLPEDIRVLDCMEQADFHALRDATGKRYRYVIHDGEQDDVFQRRYAWRVRRRLDVDSMRMAATHLLGRHDFSSFEAAGAPRADSVRTIRDIAIARPEFNPELIWIEVEADGFLYNMVRNIVGVLQTVGEGKQPPGWTADVLARRNRKAASATAPPHGLFLLRVDYEDGVGERAAETKEQGGSGAGG